MVENSYKVPVILVIGCAFLAAAIFVMSNGHLHEDAYILFQYSKKLSHGQGITFDTSAGPTEGATDFLWMVSLAAFSSIWEYIDIGSAAAILNTIGIMLIANVIIILRGRLDALSLSAIGAVVFSGGFAAAFGGFSTLAYGALYAALTLFVIQKKTLAVMALAILISLFRPDGVILAFGGLLAYIAYADRNEWKKMVAMTCTVLVAGLTYFCWRWNYFEMILPLPLLVKQRTDLLLEGLRSNLSATKHYWPLLIPLVFFRRNIDPAKFWAIVLGPALLFIALAFAHQSQNVGDRFQFPIILSILFLLVVSVPELKGRLYFFAAIPLLAMLNGAKIIKSEISYLLNDDYINNFPQLLKAAGFKVDKIAITEAGRFPFWLDAKEMIDIVGLNSRDIVLNGAESVLNAHQPELVFVHHAGRYNVDKLKSSAPYVIVQAKQIGLNDNYAGKNPVKTAPVAALSYAKKNNLTAVLVRYGSKDQSYSHVYFLKNSLDLPTFVYQLNRSIYNKTTYYSSINNISPTFQ